MISISELLSDDSSQVYFMILMWCFNWCDASLLESLSDWRFVLRKLAMPMAKSFCENQDLYNSSKFWETWKGEVSEKHREVWEKSMNFSFSFPRQFLETSQKSTMEFFSETIFVKTKSILDARLGSKYASGFRFFSENSRKFFDFRWLKIAGEKDGQRGHAPVHYG